MPTIRAFAEALEPRRLLAAVTFDAGGDGTTWGDPLNWSNDAVPTAADDVTLDVPGDLTVVLTGTRTVGSLDNRETIEVTGSSAGGDGRLNIGGPSSVPDSTNSGTIVLTSTSASQAIDAFIRVGTGATLTNASGGTIRGEAGSQTSSVDRDIDINGGNVTGGGATFVNNGAVVAGDGVQFEIDPAFSGDRFENVGDLLVAGSASLILSGMTNITDSAAEFLSAGRILVSDGGSVSFPSGTTQQNADIEVRGSGTANLQSLEVNNGAIRLLDGADLTIDPSGSNGFENRGILDLSPTSTLSVVGDVTFGGVSQPVVRSEIASATEFGRLEIDGSLDLNSPDSTSRFDPDLVGGFDPDVGDSFDVITATGGITNSFDSFQGGEDPSGDVLAVSRPDANTVAVTVVPGPLPPAPQILGQAFEFETRLAVTFQFDQDVSAFLSRSDYTIVNTDTGEVLPQSAGVLTFNTTSNEAVLDLSGDVPNGNYTLTVEASDIANAAGVPASGSPITLDFFVLAGDANRDRAVTIADFALLRSNFGGGGVFSDGDFNYDGQVTIADFAILRSNFGSGLSRPTPAASLFADEEQPLTAA